MLGKLKMLEELRSVKKYYDAQAYTTRTRAKLFTGGTEEDRASELDFWMKQTYAYEAVSNQLQIDIMQEVKEQNDRDRERELKQNKR